jgi:hypothetical protein
VEFSTSSLIFNYIWHLIIIILTEKIGGSLIEGPKHVTVLVVIMAVALGVASADCTKLRRKMRKTGFCITEELRQFFKVIMLDKATLEANLECVDIRLEEWTEEEIASFVGCDVDQLGILIYDPFDAITQTYGPGTPLWYVLNHANEDVEEFT